MSGTYGTAGDQAPDPAEVLLAEIARTTAAVQWLHEQVSTLGAEALVKGTRFVRTTTDDNGKKVTVAEAGVVRHGLLTLYLEERQHLRALCRDALRIRPEEDTGEGVSLLDELAARRATARHADTSGRQVPEVHP